MRVKNLTTYDNGWMWAVEETDSLTNETTTTSYRTDKSGNGLWVERFNQYGSYLGYVQCLGSSQFSLSAKRESARQQIKRHFSPPSYV